MKTPNSKSQTPNKLQTPGSKPLAVQRTHILGLGFGISLEFGFCCLVFGPLTCRPTCQ